MWKDCLLISKFSQVTVGLTCNFKYPCPAQSRARADISAQSARTRVVVEAIQVAVELRKDEL